LFGRYLRDKNRTRIVQESSSHRWQYLDPHTVSQLSQSRQYENGQGIGFLSRSAAGYPRSNRLAGFFAAIKVRQDFSVKGAPGLRVTKNSVTPINKSFRSAVTSAASRIKRFGVSSSFSILSQSHATLDGRRSSIACL